MNHSIQSHKDLFVWQKSMNTVELVYRCTNLFPPDERFGLVVQMRRSAVSIPSNIAEGKRRGTRREYRQFLLVAYASGAELETQLEIARRLSMGDASRISEAEGMLSEIMRMLKSPDYFSVAFHKKLQPTPYNLQPHP